MQSEALKPCPFCGGNNLRFRLSDIEGWIAHVECTDCDDMLGPMSEWKHDEKEDAEKDAAAVWNKRAALEAALSAAEPEKPAAEEYRHPEWIWYCESTTGPMVTFGRWAKNPQQKRYKLADIQPTEHDHPAPSVAVRALEKIAESGSHSMTGDGHAYCVEEALSALSAQVQDVAGTEAIAALKEAEPYVEICHSLMTQKETRANVWRVLKQVRAAIAAAPAKQEGGHD